MVDIMSNLRVVAGIIVALVIIIAIIGYLSVSMQNQGKTLPISGNNMVALQLTDPPQVPTGTQALTVSYNSLEVHVSETAHSGWLQSNSSGSINLLSLLNLSQTIGSVNVSSNATIDMVRFFVTSANITVNGTTYNVTLPSSQVTAKVEGDTSINASSSVLLSLSPTVVTILTPNNTVFVMVPEVKAIIFANGTNQSTVVVGARHELGDRANHELERITPNITITGTSLAVSGNNTVFSVTVMNNANQSVIIKNIGLSGNISTSINTNAIVDNAARLENELRDKIRNSTACVNLSTNTTGTNNLTTQDRIGPEMMVNGTLNGSEQGGMGNYMSDVGVSVNATMGHGNSDYGMGYRFNSSELGDIGEQIQAKVGVGLNRSICSTEGFAQFQNEFRNRTMNITARFGMQQMHFKEVHFLVASNGTLMLPYNLEDFNNTGYVLQPNQSYTFSFNGSIVTSDGGLAIMPITNNTYVIKVVGETGAHAFTNVTANAG